MKGRLVDVSIDRGSRVPIYLQISRSIKDQILSGGLPEGFKLPPERLLAAELGVNRSTILNAYRELKADGLVDAHVGRGTSVLPRRFPEASAAGGHPMPWRELMCDRLARVQDPLVRDLLETAEQRDVIALSVGLPAPELLPLGAVEEVQATLLRELGTATLLHCPTEGVTALRESVATLMTERGIDATVDDVMITSGSQQGLDLVARVLLDPGDAVVVEEPSFFGALQVFRGAQARLLGVPVDAGGMRTDALEAVLERQRPKLIYTLPTFQNPSGVEMAPARRRHLLDLAARFQVPVLEDDTYSDLRYEGEPVAPLKAMDRNGHVLYLGSFSKVLFPGLRVGWMVAPRTVLRQLVLAKQALDLHSSTPGQWLIDRLLRGGYYRPHLDRVREAYRHRRDVMLDALRQAPSELSWRRPAGGFYVWCRFPRTISQSRLIGEAASRRVSYLPGTACFVDDPGDNHLRLNFTFSTPEAIRTGVGRLLEAFRAVAAEPRATDGGGGTPPIV